MIAKVSRKKSKSTKIRKRTKKHSIGGFISRHQQIIQLAYWLTGIILLIVAIMMALKYTILSSKHTIKTIVYAQSSVNVYDHPQIYADITAELSGKNYFMTKRFAMDDLHEVIMTQHPIVKSIAIAQKDHNILYVELVFQEPSMVFWTPVSRFALYAGEFYDLNSGNALGNEATIIQLPAYTSGYHDLNGMLYNIDEASLNLHIETIVDTLGSQYLASLTYLPGGSKLIALYKNKTIYFHLDKDINIQLAKLVDLESHYNEFAELEVIDAGSVDDIIAR